MYGWAGVRRCLLGLVEVTRTRDTWPQFTHEGERPVTLHLLCLTQCYANQKGILYEDSRKKDLKI